MVEGGENTLYIAERFLGDTGPDVPGDTIGEFACGCKIAELKRSRLLWLIPCRKHTPDSKLISEVERLEAELADWRDTQRNIMAERCGDEQHCTCVPVLRREVERLREENALLLMDLNAGKPDDEDDE